MRDGQRPHDGAAVASGLSPAAGVDKRDEPVEGARSGPDRRAGLRGTMDVIHECIDQSNNFVGAAEDEVSPETARSLTLLVARLRRACDGLESQLGGRGGALSRGPSETCTGGGVVLSRREQQIAQLLADGYSSVNIAACCGVTSNTVRTLMRRLYRKLGVRNRADLVREVLRLSSRIAT